MSLPSVPQAGRPVLNEDGSITVHAVYYHDGTKYLCACSNYHRTGRDYPVSKKRSYWGNGYAEDAVNTVISFCTDTLKLKRLCATIDDQNERSKKLIEKLDFSFVALLPEADFGGRVADVAYYSRLLPQP